MNKQPNKDMRNELIARLTRELPVLRVKLGISQEELAAKIGVSRQTINAIEGEKREMTWGMFLSLVYFFDVNEQSSKVLSIAGICSDELRDQLTVHIDNESGE